MAEGVRERKERAGKGKQIFFLSLYDIVAAENG